MADSSATLCWSCAKVSRELLMCRFMDVELQQRAVEYMSLERKPDLARSNVVAMPPWEKRKSLLLRRMAEREVPFLAHPRLITPARSCCLVSGRKPSTFVARVAACAPLRHPWRSACSAGLTTHEGIAWHCIDPPSAVDVGCSDAAVIAEGWLCIC